MSNRLPRTSWFLWFTEGYCNFMPKTGVVGEVVTVVVALTSDRVLEIARAQRSRGDSFSKAVASRAST